MAPKSLMIVCMLNLLFFTEIGCQITHVPSDVEDACIGSNVTLDWAFGDAANFQLVQWKYIDSSSVETTIMQYANGGTALPVNNYKVVHGSNGAITLTDVSTSNTGSYSISVTYSSATLPGDSTVSVTVKEECTTPGGGGSTPGETTAPTSKTTQTSSSTNQGDGPPIEIIVPCVGVILFLIGLIFGIVWLIVYNHEIGGNPGDIPIWLVVLLCFFIVGLGILVAWLVKIVMQNCCIQNQPAANKSSEQQLKERETTNNEKPCEPEAQSMQENTDEKNQV